MLIRKVKGNSMRPGIQPGAVVMARRREPQVGDVVIARQATREVIKRVTEIRDGRYVLRGDNALESVDSREFGPVEKRDILGVVMIKLPVAVEAPKPRTNYAVRVGLIAAGVMIVMALVHLFRIDTLIPILNLALPGDVGFAALIAAKISVVEVFAVPFLLRMKLSPLARIISGFFVVLAPLIWLLISIWNYGYPQSLGELGEFAATPSDWLLVGVNLIWLGFNFWILRLLGYDKSFDVLRKQR